MHWKRIIVPPANSTAPTRTHQISTLCLSKLKNYGSLTVGEDPMRLCLSCPPINKETCGNEERPRYHQRNPKFWLPNSIIALLHGSIYTILARSTDLCPEKEANAEGDVVQSTYPYTFAIFPCPERGKCREYKIDGAIDEGHIKGQNLDNWLRKKQYERSCERNFQCRCECAIWIIPFGVEVIVASLIDESCLSALQ